MANNKRTIHIGLDYSQFTGGVTEINRKMGLLDAEFKLATEQAKNYGDETDELGVKQEYLTQKIILQTRKVEEAKQAYDAAMSSSLVLSFKSRLSSSSISFSEACWELMAAS